MKRIRGKKYDFNKIQNEGQWIEAVVSDIRKTHFGKYIIYVRANDYGTDMIRIFETDPMSEKDLPVDIGIGSECEVCIWDSDEYFINLDGNREANFV